MVLEVPMVLEVERTKEDKSTVITFIMSIFDPTAGFRNI